MRKYKSVIEQIVRDRLDGEMWYIASPITNCPLPDAERVRQVDEIVLAFVEAGIPCFAPATHFYFGKHTPKLSHKMWMERCSPHLDLCGALLVFNQPGWLKSKGVKQEIEWANEAGIVVYNTDPEPADFPAVGDEVKSDATPVDTALIDTNSSSIDRAKAMLAETSTVLSSRRAYGPPEGNLGLIAEYWQTHLRGLGRSDITITKQDVAAMMGLVKLGRLARTSDHKDSWVDLAGYAAIGHAMSGLEGKPKFLFPIIDVDHLRRLEVFEPSLVEFIEHGIYPALGQAFVWSASPFEDEFESVSGGNMEATPEMIAWAKHLLSEYRRHNGLKHKHKDKHGAKS